MTDLMSLPDINFIETDPELITNEIIIAYEAIAKKTLSPADPVRLFLLSIASMIIQQRTLINQVAKQNLLRYATGDYLDHAGARVETSRIPAQVAQVTVRFTLSSPQLSVVTVPLGTRVSPDGQLFFETIEVKEIAIGNTYVDVLCECTEVGEVGNGYAPGQITTIVDPFQWLASVTNTTTSVGGAEQESDDNYRERIYLAPESFSTAGPEGAYVYWAKTANIDIVDVSVLSPNPSEVVIRPLLKGGEIPAQPILDAVLAVVNDKKVRPLTDDVSVVAPSAVQYDVTATYYIDSANSANSPTIQAAVNTALNDYLIWQKSKLGRDIDPSELIYRLKQAGAKRVAVTFPVYTALDNTQVAADDVVSLTYGGLEDA